MDNIAVMMTRNEEDIIEEVLTSHLKFFDDIRIIDGSDDDTFKILENIKKSTSKITYLFKQDETRFKGIQSDSIRQIVLDTIKDDAWITLIHGDEIFYHNPIDTINKANNENAGLVKWFAMQFFLHKEDEKGYEERRKRTSSVQELITWYAYPWLEIRQFKFKPDMRYLSDLQRHDVLPYPANKMLKEASFHPVYKHYSYRGPEVLLKRANDRLKSGFQWAYKEVLSKGCFYEKFQPKMNYNQRKFDGTFHEFDYIEGIRIGD